MEEEDNVEEKWVGNRTVKYDFPYRPCGLIGRPEHKSKEHEDPETALLAWTGNGVGGADRERYDHERQAHDVGECGECGAGLVVYKTHRGKGQSDSGRCDEPAVAPNETHSLHSMRVASGKRGASGSRVITLVIASGVRRQASGSVLRLVLQLLSFRGRSRMF